MPNFRGRRFTNAHETLIWAARDAGAKGYTFNYEALKAGNEDVQVRSDWTLALCTGEERLKRRERQEAASDPKAGGTARARASRRLATRRSGARPVLRHRHDRCGGQAPGRRFVGIEREPSYAKAAKKRVAGSCRTLRRASPRL